MTLVIWFCVVWFSTTTVPGVGGELHVFETVERCQAWRAHYLDSHGDHPDEYVISQCKPKEIE